MSNLMQSNQNAVQQIKPLQSAVSDMNPRGFYMEEFSENSAWKNSEEFLIGNVIRESIE